LFTNLAYLLEYQSYSHIVLGRSTIIDKISTEAIFSKNS